MRNSFIAALLSAGCLIGLSNAANAENSGSKSFDSDKYLKDSAMVSIRPLGAVVGLAIGTPVAILKSAAQGVTQYTDAVGHELDKPDGSIGLLLASAAGQPLRLAGNCSEAALNGALGGLEQGWNKPFSAESFSLKDRPVGAVSHR